MFSDAQKNIRLVRFFDLFGLWSGKIVAWLIIPMVMSLVYEVVSRYVFNAPTVWAYDMTFMTYGTFFMLGSAYTLMRSGHIRTDSFYGSWPVRRQGWVDAVCYIFFFFPPLILFLWVTWDFFAVSFMRNERSVTSPWMPLLYPLKFVMPLTCVLLLLQGISELIRSIHAYRFGEWIPRPHPLPVFSEEEKPNV